MPSDEEVGQWRDVIIPFDQFHLTYRGYLEEPCLPFDGRDLKHVGIMMAERKPGPFKIEVEHISVCRSTRVGRRYTGIDTHLVDDPL